MDKQFLKRVRRKDKIAKTIIQVCGIMVIVCVFAILALIVKVTLPLLSPSRLTDAQAIVLSDQINSTPLAIGIDSYGDTVHLIDQGGRISFLDAKTGAILSQHPIRGQGENQIKQIEQYKNSFYNILWQDSSLSMIEVRYQPKFDTDGKRTIEASLQTI